MVFILCLFMLFIACKNMHILGFLFLILVFFAAIYNWKSDSRFALPLEIGDTVQILEECEGWYRGFASKNRAHKGIFPQNYIFTKVNLKLPRMVN